MSTDHAYAAGLIDGEGTIGLCRQRSNEYRSPLISVPSCTRELVDWLKLTYGGCVSTKRTYKIGHSKSYVWSVTRQASSRFLELLLPFMREPEKVRRARMIVDEYENVTSRNGRYSQEDKKLKREFESRFFEYTRMKRGYQLSDAASMPPRPPKTSSELLGGYL